MWAVVLLCTNCKLESVSAEFASLRLSNEMDPYVVRRLISSSLTERQWACSQLPKHNSERIET